MLLWGYSKAEAAQQPQLPFINNIPFSSRNPGSSCLKKQHGAKLIAARECWEIYRGILDYNKASNE